MTWLSFFNLYSNMYYKTALHLYSDYSKEALLEVQKACEDFRNRLEKEFYNNAYKTQMLLAAEAIQVMCELVGINTGVNIARRTNTKEWLMKYRQSWLESNKESELTEIEKIFLAMEK